MDFAVSEEQNELAGLVRRIVGDRLHHQRLREVETSAEHIDRQLWAELAQAGILAAALPEHVGGTGLGLLAACSVLIELGRAAAPVPYLSTIAVAAPTLAEFGDAAQRARWGEPAGRGELLLACALAEDLNDAPERPTTRATADGATWVLDGAKAVVPHGSVADAILVPATTPDGPATFVVLPGDPGVTLTAQVLVDGDVAPSLELVGVRLPTDRRLGGPETVDWLLARYTIGLCALQLGIVERALELTVAYARERQQFGRPIGSFQAVAQRLADAYIDVEAVRLTMWEAAWRIAEGLPATAELATAKYWAAEAGHRVAHTAVHVHGGTGIDTDGPLHRYFVGANRAEFTLGSATDHLRRLGRELAETPA